MREMRPTSSNYAFCGLKRHGFEVIHTSFCTRVNHGKFSADLITCDRVVPGELRGIGDDIEIRKCGLDHDDVGTFGYITLLPSDKRGSARRTQMRCHSQ